VTDIVVQTKGLDELNHLFDRLPDVAEEAAVLAINRVARSARTRASREIREQVNFTASYLDDTLSVVKFASEGSTEAVIRGRFDPTSLARFATTPVRFGRQRGVRVKVDPGAGAKRMERAFYMRLRRGNTDITGESFNVGLAMRLKPGERIINKKRMRPIGDSGLVLLYGPSVDQVFDDVAADINDDVSAELVTEFVRQFERLSNG
jgi:hypothetical protein